jgi:xylitol oxidase
MTDSSVDPGTNWSESVTYAAAELRRPGSVEALQELVAAAPRVKALGTRHSFTDVADSPGGVLVDTSALDVGGVVVDHGAMTASVPGSWSYAAVAEALEAEGVALHNMGSLPHISVAGGTATGTHGSGDGNRVLAAAIRGLELVTADGSLLRVGVDDPRLPAMAVGLGAFGVMTRVTLQVEPSYWVRQHLYKEASWADVLANLDDVFASAYSVNLHANFSPASTRTIWQKERLATDAGGDLVLPDVADVRWGASRLDVVDLDPGRVTPITEPGRWLHRLPHFVPGGAPSVGGDELQSEWFVDRTDAVAAIEALRRMGDRIDPHLHGTEIRTVAADDLWMSPAYGRDCLSLGFTWKKHPAEVTALLAPIEEALAPFAPTVHWGKLFAMGRPELCERLPRLDDFLELATSMDPTGTFRNPFIDRLAAQ